MSASDITPTGVTLIISQSGGNITDTLITGPDFYLDVKTDNGWEVLKAKDGSNIWNFAAYSIPLNDSIEFEIDWINIYGVLTPGTYRLCKTVLDHYPTEDGHCHTYSIEFTIK